MKYIVIRAQSPSSEYAIADLMSQVSRHMSEGYHPQGGVDSSWVKGKFVCHQAMIYKPAPKPR